MNFSKSAHLVIVIVLIPFLHIGAYSQVIFSETFDESNGSTSGTDNSGNGINWSSTCSTCIPSGDWFEVRSGKMEGTDTNGPGVWTTDEIDISNCPAVNVSFDITESGTMESCSGSCGCNCVDWVKFEYNVDNTGWVTPAGAIACNAGCAGSYYVSIGDVSGTLNYTSPCINGDSTIRLRISVQTWAASESYRFDNVKVECAPINPGISDTVSVCSSGSQLNLLDELGGTPDSGGIWTGPSILNNGSLGTYDPSVNTIGTYTYTVSSNGCTASADVFVKIQAPYAGGDTSIILCGSDTITSLFAFIPAGPDNGGTWYGPSILDSGHVGYYDPSTDLPGSYEYIVGNGPSCSDTSIVSIIIETPPNAGIDTSITICISENPIMLLSLSGGDSLGTWTGSVVLSDTFGIFHPGVHPDGAYLHEVSGTVCQADTSIITIDVVNAVDATIDPNQVIDLCVNDAPIDLDGATSGGIWTASCGSCINSSTGVFDPASAGNGMIKVTYSINGVCSDADSIVFSLLQLPSIQVYVDYYDFCENDSVLVSAMGENLVWSTGDSGNADIWISDTGSFFIVASNICGTDVEPFNLQYLPKENCEEPIPVLTFPNIITLNGDNYNESFMAMSSENIAELEVQIFNRWGEVIGEYGGVSNGWGGTMQNGSRANSGTYYFVAKAIDVNNKPLTVKGHFMLTRN